MRVEPLALAVLIGCGRVAFDAPRDGASDGNHDAPAADTPTPVDCTIAHPTAAFCSSFEGPGLSDWLYEIEQFGDVATTTTLPMRGAQSLESHTEGIGPMDKAARYGWRDLGGINSGDLYARGYFRLSAASVVNGRLSLVSLLNGDAPYPGAYVGREGTTDVVLHMDGLEQRFTTTPFPTDQWVCVELHVAIDPTNGFVEVTFDGGAPIRTTNQRTTVAGGYTSLDVGIHLASAAQTPLTLWTDEVVLGTQPIGCN